MTKIIVRPNPVNVTVGESGGIVLRTGVSASASESALRQEYTADCAADVQVGDVVFVDGENAGVPHVAQADNRDGAKLPAAGIAIAKPTSTTCTVRHGGVVSNLSGLVRGADHFVGEDGAVSASVPVPSGGEARFIQRIGVAKTATGLLLEIGNEIIEI